LRREPDAERLAEGFVVIDNQQVQRVLLGEVRVCLGYRFGVVVAQPCPRWRRAGPAAPGRERGEPKPDPGAARP